MPSTRDRARRILVLLSVVLCAIYLVVCTVNSLTRARLFSPDSMIYVDVARNLAEGRGLTQSSLGIHEHRFLGQQTWPVPFTSQPLYPLLIAGLARFGVGLEDAALILPALAMAGIFCLAWLLLARAWGKEAAWLGLALLAFHHPLRFASLLAWSDTPGLMLALAALLPWRGQSLVARGAFAGLCCGLAFAMRYALAPLCVASAIGLLVASRDSGWRKRIASLVAFGACASACVLPVLVHNLEGSENWHPLHHTPLVQALTEVFSAFLGGNFALLPAATEGALLLALVASGLLIARRKGIALKTVALPAGGVALASWIAIYLAFIAYTSMTIHLDSPGLRLLLPATVPFILWLAGLLASATRLPATAALAICAASLAIRNYEEFQYLKQPPAGNVAAARVAASERLRWIQKNTGPQDVVIGDEMMDVPFALGPLHVGSFSQYPTTEYPECDKLLAWADGPGKFAKRIYLVIRKPGRGPDRIRERFGNLIGDLMAGKTDACPRVIKSADLADAVVFEVLRP